MKTLSNEDVQLIVLLETRTGAKAVDVVRTETGFVFLLKEGEIGKAIGRDGSNLARLRREFGKEIDFVEFSENKEQFARNLFKPVEVLEVREDGNRLWLKVDPQRKGLAIGRGGERIKRARTLLKDYFGVEDVKIS